MRGAAERRPCYLRAKAQLGRGIAVAQGWATAFYHSPAWLKNRANYLKRPLDTPLGTIPPGMCERCFEMGELVPAKVVHHKVHLTPANIDDPHVALNYDNFQRLCQDCHAFVHSDRTESRVTFDENGNIVAPDPMLEFRRQMERLTETVDERRNIHRSEAHG